MPLWFAAGAGGVVCIAPVLSGQIHLDLQRDVRRGPDGCLIFSFFFFFLLCFFFFGPPNYLQLDRHSDGLHLPCIIRLWRHFTGYGEYVSVSSTLSYWQTVFYSMCLSDCFMILQFQIISSKSQFSSGRIGCLRVEFVINKCIFCSLFI